MHKKSLFRQTFLLLLVILSTNTAAQNPVPIAPDLDGTAWILIDANTGFVIAENNADEPLPPASLAKMMTTYIAVKQIKQGTLSDYEEVLVSDNAWEKGGAKTDGSTMFLSPRTTVPVIDLMRGIIIQSGNDAAIALAEHISGSEDEFSNLMNHYAVELGMNKTFYYNSTGLPAEGMVSSARDQAKLAKAIIEIDPDYYALYSEKYFQHNDINQPNRNRLLWRDSSVDGLKTGYTKAAGYCLAASARRKDMRLISVLLGSSSAESRARQTQKLLSFGFRHFDTKKIYTQGDILKDSIWAFIPSFGYGFRLRNCVRYRARIQFPPGAILHLIYLIDLAAALN